MSSRIAEQAPATTRLAWADAGRGLAIALVTLYHASSWLNESGLAVGPWQDACAVLTTLRMPLFFVVSGMFATKWLQAGWRSLLSRKVLLFAWVFLVWEIVGTLLFPLGLTAAHRPIGFTGLVRGLLLSPVMPRYELWFIWALALFFVVARATRRLEPAVQLVIAGLGSAVGMTLWVQDNSGWTGSLKFYFFFLAGMYGRRLLVGFAERTKPLVLGLLFLAWAAVSVALFGLHARQIPGLFFLNAVLGVVGGIALSRCLARVGWLTWLGRRTLRVYLAHTPFILVMVYVLSLRPLFGVASHVALLLPPVVTAAAVLLSLGLYSLCVRIGADVVYEPPRLLVALLERPGTVAARGA